MNELEEFEFRRRYEMEQAAQRTAGMTHSESIDPVAPRKESKPADVFRGLGQSFSDIGLGLTQRVMELTGNPKAAFIRQQVANERNQRPAREALEGAPSFAHSVGKFVGDAALPTAAGFLTGPSISAGMATAGLTSLLRPTASTSETASNVVSDMTLAGLSQLGMRGIAPRPLIEPEHRAAIEAGRRAGIPYSGGQIANNPIVQRTEAHAQWNPLTKWHAIPLTRKQDDSFIKGLLRESGVNQSQIPKNPSLNADMLDAAHTAISARYEKVFPSNATFDLSNQAQPALWTQLRQLRPNNINLVEDDRKIVADVARQVRQIVYSNNGNVPAPLLHDTIRLVDESRKRLTSDGAKMAGDKLKSLYDQLLNALPNKSAYEAVDADYARLMTIEDLLRRSKGMGEGVPDRAKLSAAVERGLPGGVIRNKSTMADLARGGEKSVGVGALPDRATGLPIPSDVPNALTYWRWNNPLAIAGMNNPLERDMVEMALRYLPGTALRERME